MINGVSDALRLAGQLAPVTQTVKPPLVASSQVQIQQLAMGQFRSIAFERWAKMTEAQHRVSSAQLAAQSLGQMIQLLRKMQKLLPAAMRQQGDALSQLSALREQICQQQPSYLGIPLFDQQLNLRIFQRRNHKRRFRLRSINPLGSKRRDEQLTLHIPTPAGIEVVNILLPADADSFELMALLNQALSPAGLQIEQDAEGLGVFVCDELQWQLLDMGITMAGEGQRLPAGEACQVMTQEVLHWQDPREWELSSPAGVKQTQAKLEKCCRKLEQQLLQTREQLKLTGNLLHRHPQIPATQLLSRLDSQLKPGPFARQLTALLAQANLGRQQANSLLI